MTPEQIAVVQESFQQVATIADQAAELFYHHLFSLDPPLKRLFPSDMHTGEEADADDRTCGARPRQP
jgi:Globin